uniref:Immunoglobulin heavy variable 8-2 n=1 Tax=Oncorhynchus tshawytscha TaxID=74940 RepID=A0A8C8F5Y2_ONCTS
PCSLHLCCCFWQLSYVSLFLNSSMVVKPVSLTLSCRISITRYCLHWIRQPEGKALEWMGYKCSSEGTETKDLLKSKTSFTVNTSSNTLYLQMNSLKSEDTAVYYCAQYTY